MISAKTSPSIAYCIGVSLLVLGLKFCVCRFRFGNRFDFENQSLEIVHSHCQIFLYRLFADGGLYGNRTAGIAGNIHNLTPSAKAMGVFLLVSVPLAAEGAPQTEDINGSFQLTRIGTQASHLAEIRDVHF